MKPRTKNTERNPFAGINPSAVMFNQNGTIYAVKPPEFCALKHYSEEEFSGLIQTNPSFLAMDAHVFKYNQYVRNIALLYVRITFSTLEKVTSSKKFWIRDLERALLKLSQEHPSEYSVVCREFDIDPKRQKSNMQVVNLSGITPDPILRLSSWGYAEMFSPHLLDIVPKLAGKFFSVKGMTDTEKAKLAHLFFMFVASFHRMPYDEERFELLLSAEEAKKGEAITKSEKTQLYDELMQEILKIEREATFEAIMLENAYTAFYQDYADDSFDADSIMYWLTHIVDKDERYKMLEFVDMLTETQKAEFYHLDLKAIEFNDDVRAIKEKIFPFGAWVTGLQTFLLKPDEKYMKVMSSAYRKYFKSGFQFGKDVKSYQREYIEVMYAPAKTVNLPGYLYASSPALRISDVNELRMFHICEVAQSSNK